MTRPRSDAFASLVPTGVDMSWSRMGARAACRDADPDLFFDRPARESPTARQSRRNRAKNVCGGCPLRTECLTHALELPERDGVWGGLDEDERRRMRRSSAQAGEVAGDRRTDADWPCGHCGTKGRREGTGPNGEKLIASCFKRWKRAGRPDHIPAADPVRSRAARGAA